MERNGRLLLWIVVAMGVFTSPASARWIAQARGPDVFGIVNVVAGVHGSTRESESALVVSCNTEDDLDLALTGPAPKSILEKLSGRGGPPAKLLINVDGGAAKTFDAEVKPWTESRMGIVVRGRTPELISAIRAIGSATSSIGVGVDMLGGKDSDEFDANGSTEAMQTVIDKCKL